MPMISINELLIRDQLEESVTGDDYLDVEPPCISIKCKFLSH